MSDCFEVSRPRDYLATLPTELICRILGLCSILDVVANIRRCCKHLGSISRDRSVWLALLRQLGNQVAIPVEFSFPLSTLTSGHLERLATSHLHFRQRVLSHAPHHTDEYLLRFHQRVLSNLHDDVLPYKSSRDIPLSPGAQRGCIDAHLFPGGQYLLTVNDQLQLWDLGRENTATPRCLTSSQLQGGIGPLSEVNIRDLSFREGKYRFLVLITDDSTSADSPTLFYRYTIVPNCSSPIFDLDSPPVIHTPFFAVCAYDGQHLVAFLGIHELHICHFGLPMRLAIPLPREIEDNLLDDYVMQFIGNTAIAVWGPIGIIDIFEFPQFFDVASQSPESHIIHLVNSGVTTLLWSRDDNHQGSFVREDSFKPIHGESESESLTFYCTLIGDGQRYVLLNKLHKCQTPDSSNPTDEWVLETIHQEQGYSSLNLIDGGDDPRSFTSPDMHRIIWWKKTRFWDATVVMLQLSNLKGTNNVNGKEEHKCNLFHWPEEEEWPNFSFVPFVGRLAATRLEAGCISIYDYLD